MKHLSTIYFQQEDLIRKNSLQQTLCIQAMSDRCRIIITDEEKNVLLLEEQATPSFLNKEWSFVNLRFAETKILFLPESFIFVPKEFDAQGADNPFASFLDTGSPISQAEIIGTNIRTHYTVNALITELQTVLSDSTVVPSANVFIHYLLSMATPNEEYIGINLYEDCFELVYVKNEEFIFYNRFPKENADDFNFYLLSVFDQFGIQPANAHFYLAGDVFESDEHYERLSKYSTHLHFSSAQSGVSSSPEIEPSTGHSFFLLSELSKCE